MLPSPKLSLTSEELMALEEQWGVKNYASLPVVLKRAEGVWMWDVADKKYLDMMSAYSAISFGHCHPRLLATLIDQAHTLSLCSRAYYNDVLPRFLEKLCTTTGMQRAIPMNTGAEAVETAIKAARRWGYMVKKIPDNQAEIIVCSENFHGRTIGIISFSSEPSYKKGFGPFLTGFKTVPFGDAKTLEAAITPHTCAVLTEPIQGEAGIIVPPKGWLKSIEQICRKNNVLLIVDEIQSGLGRTGEILACDHENVKPDGVILGKALGGGYIPVSALVGSDELMGVFTPGSHGSTFGGNPLAAAMGLKSLELLEEERLCERSTKMGQYLMNQLQQINSPIIKDIRGLGLWIGVEINTEKASARNLCEQLLKFGILTKETHESVLRFAPPLIINQEELDWSLQRIRQVLSAS